MQENDDELFDNAPKLQLLTEGDDSAGRPGAKTARGLDDNRRTVSLFDAGGEHIGFMSMKEALALAKDRDLRLFIVQPNAIPLVAQTMKLRRETFSIRVYPHQDSLNTPSSRKHALVLHIDLTELEDTVSVKDLAERLYSILVKHFGSTAKTLLPAENAIKLAEEIWTRGFGR